MAQLRIIKRLCGFGTDTYLGGGLGGGGRNFANSKPRILPYSSEIWVRLDVPIGTPRCNQIERDITYHLRDGEAVKFR